MPITAPDPSLLSRLRERLGPAGVLAPEDAARVFEEPRGKYPGHGAAVVRPATVEDAAFLVAAAAEAGAPIVPWGGGTGLVGGQTTLSEPAPIVVSLERMTKIRAVSTEEAMLVAEAGVVLAAVQNAAEEAGRLFPLSLASEGSCTIGGCLAANAGGVGVLRYGNMRDLCLGVEAVLPDGSVFNGLSGLRKDNRGYDLRHLLIGSEGTLGLITAASLKLFPRPKRTATALAAVARPADAVALLRRLQDAVGDSVSAFELMSGQGMDFVTRLIDGVRDPFEEPHAWYALIELGADDPEPMMVDALEAAMEDGLALDALPAATEAQRAAFWRIREETPIANKIVGAICSHDISLPIAALERFIDDAAADVARIDPAVRINCFGHVGDGNLHYNAFPPEGGDRRGWADKAPAITEAIHSRVFALGGSISAEHGVGRAKVKDLERFSDPAKLAAMRAIKRALDPKGIMNPGAILDPATVYAE